jgi:outer membrane protein assembly factor BamC
LPGARTHLVLGTSALFLALAGCTSYGVSSGDRVDYRAGATKINTLEVPPDLAQLNKEGRYQSQRGVVSASALPAAGTTRTSAASSNKVAPIAMGEFKVERDGDKRWLNVPRTPEQVWPQITAFWQELGFTLVKNEPNVGIMETNWAENRAKLPQDIIRKTIGSVLDSAYSTGEMDRYRTRVERTATGSEIFISHKAMEEVYTSPQQDNTRWQPRPPDPQMEAEMLSRLLVKLGTTEAEARAAVANPDNVARPQERARILSAGPGAALEMDDGLDRAWRRVGVALDRSGFTVEDRDRAAGLYFVRYVDPKTAGMEDTTGFFSKLFGGSSDTSSAAVKYQVALRSDAGKTIVSVLNSQGAPDSGDNGKRIIAVLAEELK